MKQLKGFNMPKISIIMPSLNVKNFIRPCIESVLKQTIQDIEILSVDAGSTDGTLEILEEYATADNRLQIIHSDKKSYGYQVNLGLELAKGDYIGIVETDDYISADMYKTLYETAIAHKLEYVKAGFSQFVEVGSGLRWYLQGGRCIADSELIGKVISPRNMPELAIQDYYLWAGIYRKDFLTDIRLNESAGAAFQDIGFIYQVLSKADRAMYLSEEFYFYRQTRGNSSFNKKGFRYLIGEYEHIGKMLSHKTDDWKQAYYERMFRQTVGRYQRMAVSGQYWEETEEEANVLKEWLRVAEKEGTFVPDKMGEENQLIYRELQNNARAIFDGAYRKLQPKTERLKAFLNQIGNKQIVIFGCGKFGKQIHLLLECHKEGQTKAYSDNNALLWNEQVQGIKVWKPDEAVTVYRDAVYVIANSQNAGEIKQQLLEAGISEEQICIYRPDFDIRLFMV